jgi:hypothetical protein
MTTFSAYFEQQTVILAVTVAELQGESRSVVNRKEVDSSAEVVELARGIEPPTCGLQIETDLFSHPTPPSPEPTESPMEWPG